MGALPSDDAISVTQISQPPGTRALFTSACGPRPRQCGACSQVTIASLSTQRSSHVGRVSKLRRILNPPVRLQTNHCAIGNRAQDEILPHKRHHRKMSTVKLLDQLE